MLEKKMKSCLITFSTFNLYTHVAYKEKWQHLLVCQPDGLPAQLNNQHWVVPTEGIRSGKGTSAMERTEEAKWESKSQDRHPM